MVKAYVMMNCDLGSEKETIAKLKKTVGVKEAPGTFGLYDIIAQIESDSEERIQEIITRSIRKIPKIHSTVTLTRSESEELFRPSEKLVGIMLGQNSAQAYLVIHCDKGEEYPTLRNLSRIPEVKEVDVVFGFYDVICKVETDSDKTLEGIITKSIRTLPHIKSSMTLNVINEQSA